MDGLVQVQQAREGANCWCSGVAWTQILQVHRGGEGLLVLYRSSESRKGGGSAIQQGGGRAALSRQVGPSVAGKGHYQPGQGFKQPGSGL